MAPHPYRSAIFGVLAAVTILGGWPGAVATANDKLWSLLKDGGQVVLIRHAITTPGSGDPPGMRLDDCSTQRNLTEDGRNDARRLGAVFRLKAVPVGRVLSSPWCRCLETAQLAFGKAEKLLPLSNLFGRSQNQEQQVREMRQLIVSWRSKQNLILVSHGSTIGALTGVNPSTAEMVIVTPVRDGNFIVAGRMTAD